MYTSKTDWCGGHNKDGVYSVRSGYKTYREAIVDYGHLKVAGEWRMLWDIHVPSYVKYFVWKACRDCRPTRSRLQSKNIICPLVCSLCNVDVENCCHILLTCMENITCWKEVGLWDIIGPKLHLAYSFSHMFYLVCTKLDKDKKKKNLFCMTFWSLWRRRNDKLWEGKDVDLKHVVWQARDALHAWSWARKMVIPAHANNPECSIIWMPPPLGVVSYCVDAAIREDCG